MLALIRGAGDIASGAAMRLWRCGIDVVMTDLARPTAIRRTVAFSDAIVHGETTVEGLRAVRAENAAEAKKLLREGVLPVLADPECACREELAPDALVDAILAKRNLGTKIDDAPIVVGVGPGFTAGEDCYAVVETMRGHTLGRVIYSAARCRTRTFPASSAALRASACCARRATAFLLPSTASATRSRRARPSALSRVSR